MLSSIHHPEAAMRQPMQFATILPTLGWILPSSRRQNATMPFAFTSPSVAACPEFDALLVGLDGTDYWQTHEKEHYPRG